MLQYINRLILFEAFRNDGIATRIAGLNSFGCIDLCDISCAELLNDLPAEQSEAESREVYYSTERALLKNNPGSGEISGNNLQNHFCRVIAGEDNHFARLAESGVYKNLSPGMPEIKLKTALSPMHLSVLLLAAREIKHISPIYRFSFAAITDTRDGRDIAALPASQAEGRSKLEGIHQAMIQNKSTDAAIMLSHYYHSYGAGVFGASSALNAAEGGLVPVPDVDPVTLDDLIGCEKQKSILMTNMEILLSGFKANNMLLYGDSGTGKSSTVKALLNHYSSKGLKLISVARENLRLLPKVFEQIADRGLKFIIFIDDLSFDENEYEYKILKSIVEGRVAPRQQNAVFIVTTNRKNIVKDLWSDRDGDDVRKRDSMEEKRSLADRFGITLIYSSPAKQEYLEIVRGIAAKAGLVMPDDDLAAEALKWEVKHGGRSGRTARQFVDYMTGVKEIGLEGPIE